MYHVFTIVIIDLKCDPDTFYRAKNGFDVLYLSSPKCNAILNVRKSSFYSFSI